METYCPDLIFSYEPTTVTNFIFSQTEAERLQFLRLRAGKLQAEYIKCRKVNAGRIFQRSAKQFFSFKSDLFGNGYFDLIGKIRVIDTLKIVKQLSCNDSGRLIPVCENDGCAVFQQQTGYMMLFSSVQTDNGRIIPGDLKEGAGALHGADSRENFYLFRRKFSEQFSSDTIKKWVTACKNSYITSGQGGTNRGNCLTKRRNRQGFTWKMCTYCQKAICCNEKYRFFQ